MEQVKTLPEFEWFKELPVSITVCDDKGIILAMNDFSKKTFCKDGEDIVGHSLFDCHPPRAAGVVKNTQNIVMMLFILFHFPFFSFVNFLRPTRRTSTPSKSLASRRWFTRPRGSRRVSLAVTSNSR